MRGCGKWRGKKRRKARERGCVCSLPVDGELLADALRVLADDGAELLVRDLAVLVEVGLDDGLVDDLLQLHVVEVRADHHLEHLEQLAVADEAVAIDVVHLERDCGGVCMCV